MKAHRNIIQSLFLAGAFAIATPFAMAEGGFLGVHLGSPADALRAQLGIQSGFGLVVESLPEDSPASSGGLETNDILLEVDGQKLINNNQLVVLLNSHSPGDKIELLLMRSGKEKQISVTLGERPTDLPTITKNWKLQSMDLGNIGSILGGLSDIKSNVRVHTLGLDGKEISPDKIQEMLKGLDINSDDDLSLQIQKIVAQAVSQARVEIDSNSKNTSNSVKIVNGLAANSNITVDDGIHKLAIENNGKKKHLTVWDTNGEEIFNGPIETEKELKAVPEEIRSKIPKTNIDISSATINDKATSRKKTTPSK